MRNLNPYLITALIIAASAAGCGAPPPPEPTTPQAADLELPTPKPIAPVNLPIVVLPDGFEVTVELVQTPDEITQGLMYRSHLPEDRGMLFLFDNTRVPSFWMKNTLIPLDIIFLDEAGVVVDIALDARPCKAEPCPQYVSKEPAMAVLEVNAGIAELHGVAAGAQLSFNRVKGYPAPEEDGGDQG
jgi:uncharacterized membrane protein (UPF0127 family)